MQSQFVQIPCGKCGTTVWIAPAAGVGYCPSCHTPNQLPPGGAPAAPPAASPYGAAPGAAPSPYGAPPGAPSPYGAAPPPGAPAAPPPGAQPYAVQAPMGATGVPFQSPGLPLGRMLGGVGAAVVAIGVSLGVFFLKDKLPGRGMSKTTEFGIDSKKADAEKMILAAGTLAKKWRNDATFMKISMPAMQSDGTVDLTKNNAMVEYFSPSGVQSGSASGRKDTIKKYNFVNSDQIIYRDRWDASNQWRAPLPISAVPACKASQIAAKVPGFTPGKTAIVTLDPESMKGPAWIVNFEGKTLYLDPNTCNPK